MSFRIRWRLSVMMLLQYATQGAWFAVAGKYFTALGPQHGFTGVSIGVLFSLLPLATIVTPFFAGILADRWFNAERFLGVLHLASAGCLLALARQAEYQGIVPLMALYGLCFAPTTALTNSISFHHVTDAQRQFSGIRVFGTIGWILAGWALGAWRSAVPSPVPGDLFYLASALSVAMAAFSLFLPATPPQHAGASPLACFDALRLLRRRDFLAFMVVSFVAYTALDFHYIFASAYLGSPVALGGVGISDRLLPAVLTIAQVSEIGVMLALPFALARLGVGRAMVAGTLAWALRYAIFALVPIKAVVISSLALHGVCVSCFFVTIYIYADQIAPPQIRASVQSLVMLILAGLARYLGSFFAGAVKNAATVSRPGALPLTDWRTVFLIPAALMLACAIAFPLLFRERAVRAAEPAPARD